MPTPADFQIVPSVLVWAREQRGLTVEAAARLLQLSPGTLSALEAGDRQPSISQLRRMSDKYKRPLIVLLLDEPPTTFTALKDFRRLPESELGTFSPALHDEIKRALDEQEVYAELATQRQETVLRPTLPNIAHDAIRLANEITALLGVTPAKRSLWTQSRPAYNEWRSRVEGLGILVLESSRVKITEMRGFSLSEDSPLVIVINGEDSERGKIFTLIHELTHLCLRDSGVCDLHNSRSTNDIEVYCNAVATQVVLPDSLLAAQPVYANHQSTRPWTEADVELISRLSGGASREVVLRRLLDRGKITRPDYERRVQELHDEYDAIRDLRRRNSRGGPPPHRIQLRNRGRPFVRSAFEAYADGFVNLSQLVDLVGVRTKHLQSLQVEAFR